MISSNPRHPEQRPRRSARQSNRGLDYASLWGLLREQNDALSSFFFVVLMSLISLALAPSEQGIEEVPSNWFDFLEAAPSSPSWEAEELPPALIMEKEIVLDLPFSQEVDEAGQPAAIVRTQYYTIQRGDTLGAILRKITNDKEAISYLVTKKMASYKKLRRGRQIEYEVNDAGQLSSLTYKASPDLHLNFSRDANGGMHVEEGVPELEAKVELKSARITGVNNSLFAAADAAQVPDAITQAVIDALETRIDFQRDTRLNDSFVVIYESLTDADGDAAGSGKLLALQFSNRGNEITGLLDEANGGYFEPSGESLQRAFLRSPLKFTRVSSRYSKRRLHPVLKKWRPHRGVDFAAPTNTPVRSSADGVVDFVGKKGGYGNVIMIKHFDKYVTLYAHLNKFAKNIKRGTRVAQGQLIGYVGSTGLATGPHLHYEFRVDGKQKDPLSAAVPTNKPPLEGEKLRKFLASNKNHLVMIEAAAGGNSSRS